VIAFAWIARAFRSDRLASDTVPDARSAVPADWWTCSSGRLTSCPASS